MSKSTETTELVCLYFTAEQLLTDYMQQNPS